MIVYRLTCLPTGKVYIGITTKTLATRVAAHFSASREQDGPAANRPIMRAMRKYPRDLWHADVIGTAASWEDLCRLEIRLIAAHRANDGRYGYNASAGGEGIVPGFRPTASTIAARLGRRKTPEQVERSAVFHRGRKRSEATKRKMAASRAKWWQRERAGEVTRKPDPKIDWERDAAICVAHFETRSYRLAGARFGIKAPAAAHAVQRVCSRVADALAAAQPSIPINRIPAPLHPSWIEFALPNH